ncbi:hypothetical protein K435DRAFT_805989 [Dendrothele bispora CBS 962.96]|uniref:Uncharacterized protein n=1 Tax=Dendrothele bispora (strain CBS 962.96) TaxID=1314807 RepID=A0A4V4HD05_DENBC|nr:hypothetical protein K435DRAFT_805989 [Dendrothele bispora CBS 962.96]
MRFKDICRPPGKDKQPHYKAPINLADPEYLEACAQHHEEERNRLRQLANNFKGQNLRSRIQDAPPLLPLSERIQAPAYVPPPSLPNKMCFRCTKIINREEEMGKAVRAVAGRIEKIEEKLEEKEKETEKDLVVNIRKLIDNFKEFREDFRWKTVRMRIQLIPS